MMLRGRLGLDRAIRDAGANLTSLVVTLVVSLATFFALARFLGPNDYAHWLVLTSVPTLLSLTDFGLASAGSTRMTQLFAVRHDSEASRVYWTYAAVSFAMVGLAAAAWAAAGAALPFKEFQDVRLNLCLAAWLLLCYGSTLLEGLFRSVRRFSRGVTWMAGQRAFDATALVLAAALTSSLRDMALAQLASRLVSLAAMTIDAASVSRGRLHRPVFALVSLGGLSRPALGFVALPASQMILIQGSTLAAARFLTPVEVVAFVAGRTILGIVRQIGQSASFGMLTELTMAGSQSDMVRTRRLERGLRLMSVGVSCVGACVFFVLGSWVTELLTGHPYDISAASRIFWGVWVVAEAVWIAQIVLEMASNTHFRASSYQAIAAVVGVAGGAIASSSFGFDGLAFGFCLYSLMLLAAGVRLRFLGSTRENAAA